MLGYFCTQRLQIWFSECSLFQVQIFHFMYRDKRAQSFESLNTSALSNRATMIVVHLEFLWIFAACLPSPLFSTPSHRRRHCPSSESSCVRISNEQLPETHNIPLAFWQGPIQDRYGGMGRRRGTRFLGRPDREHHPSPPEDRNWCSLHWF